MAAERLSAGNEELIAVVQDRGLYSLDKTSVVKFATEVTGRFEV